MMKDLLWAESQKLHRSKILWIAGFATVMVGLIVFAQGQFTFYDRRYIDGAGWFMTAAQSLATFYVLPAVIALLGSYMICREEQEDTLKSLRLIPVDEVKLTLAKMILAFVFSVLIYLLLFAITFLVEAVLHLEALSVGLVLENLKIYFLDGVGVFFAISPIIALVARMKKGYWLALVFAEIYSFAGLFASMSQQLKTVYPMTAVFNISGYYNANMFQVLIGVVILMVCVILSLLILKGRQIYLNDSSFVEGDQVNTTPYFVARLWDKSGVNITGSSVGHDIMLTVDSMPSMSYNLNNYYALLPDKEGEGLVQFSIPELEPGMHTAEFKVWDILNNSTTYTFTFEVAEGLKPNLIELYATPNPARDQVEFFLHHNRPESNLKVTVMVYDMTGKFLWSTEKSGSSELFKAYIVTWNLTDNGGRRLRPGVYLYRAAISTNNSKEATKANKLIILAQ